MGSGVKLKLITKADLVFAVSLVAVCAMLLILTRGGSGGSVAVIEKDGVELYRIELQGVGSDYELTAGGTVISVTAGGIGFKRSRCPDGFCVKNGILTEKGEAAVCAPEGVVIRILGEDGYDAVAE